MVVQDLALHALGVDTWAWVQTLRSVVGAERWSRYWSAYAALPIAPARQLLAPLAPRPPVRRAPGQYLPARVLHPPLRRNHQRCRACGAPLAPRECSDVYCWSCLPF